MEMMKELYQTRQKKGDIAPVGIVFVHRKLYHDGYRSYGGGKEADENHVELQNDGLLRWRYVKIESGIGCAESCVAAVKWSSSNANKSK